jgi:hypothetical protein
MTGGLVPVWSWPLIPVRWGIPGRARMLDSRLTDASGSATLIVGLIVLYLAGLSAVGFVSYGLFWGIGWVSHQIGLTASLRSAIDAISHLLRIWPHWWRVGWHWISLVLFYIVIALVGCFAVFAYILAPISHLVDRGRSLRGRHLALRDARTRTEPYEVDEITSILVDVRSASGVRELTRILQLTPQLCSPDVINLLSDLATAAECGGHKRYRDALRHRGRLISPSSPSYVAVPPGSSPAFVAWARANRDKVADLLLRLDEETVDEITMLVAARRKNASDAPAVENP